MVEIYITKLITYKLDFLGNRKLSEKKNANRLFISDINKY